jgi:hypothetical protein
VSADLGAFLTAQFVSPFKHDTELHVRVRIGCANRLGETGQAVDASDEDVVQSLWLSQNFAPSVSLSHRSRSSFFPCKFTPIVTYIVCRHPTIVAAHMRDNAVDANDGPDRIELLLLPSRHLGVEIDSDLGDQDG